VNSANEWIGHYAGLAASQAQHSRFAQLRTRAARAQAGQAQIVFRAPPGTGPQAAPAVNTSAIYSQPPAQGSIWPTVGAVGGLAALAGLLWLAVSRGAAAAPATAPATAPAS